MKKFDKLTVCLDMRGCPNRCRHCWLGAVPNGNMEKEELRFAAREFKPLANTFEIDFWYREPDFGDNYRELWELTEELSDVKTPHFEIMSFWRAVRDKDYIPWLYSLGVRVCQLTLFGGEEKTDHYVGRKGAYGEIVKTIEMLLEHKISPRIQAFVNKDNIDELCEIERLAEDMSLEKRCEQFGGKFVMFVHQGSCDGENEKFYDAWVTLDDLKKIPPKLAEKTLEHFGKQSLSEVFGETEHDLLLKLENDSSVTDFRESSPVFYVDRNFDVYPNVSTPEPFWCLGNLKRDKAERIAENYLENKSAAQNVSVTVPVCELAKKLGNPDSMRLFSKGDYFDYLLNRYCREM
ncbi:MAG: radical SAM protein [Ruminococcaceae bacterium]|nr:radical SAM protein [Oscillospiraceae bacterium]